jgi:hypothetical protein
MVCQFIGAQAMIDTDKTGGRNPLVELAQSIDIFGARSPEEQELDRMRGPKVADSVDQDPRFQGKVAADPAAGVEAANAPGSFEAFSAMFGAAVPPPAPEDIVLSGGEG